MTPSIPAPRVTLSRDGGPSARVSRISTSRSSLGQSLGHRIGAVVVGRDDDALADEDSVAAEIDERRVGRHHARPVVVGDDERPFDRAGRDDDFILAGCATARRAAAPAAPRRRRDCRHRRHRPSFASSPGRRRLRPLARRSPPIRASLRRRSSRRDGRAGRRFRRWSSMRKTVRPASAAALAAASPAAPAPMTRRSQRALNLRIVGRRAVVGRRFGRGRPWRELRPRRSPTAARGTSCSRSPPAGTARACRGGRRDRRPPSAPH